MRGYRDAGPTYPIRVVPEFAAIRLIEYMGQDNAEVIATAPADLPRDYVLCRN
jgi:phenolic acid decarboxylase